MGLCFGATQLIAGRFSSYKKKAVRILCNKRSRESCRQLFKQENILTLSEQYIYDILSHIADNFDSFLPITEVHNYNTRNNKNLFTPTTSLSLFQKGSYFTAIKIFNSLPSQMKELIHSNKKLFKCKVKSLLLDNTFYTVNEYINFISNK